MPIRTSVLHQVVHNGLATAHEARRETSPEGPASPLEHALAHHVVLPLTRAVEAVAVALDGQASPFVALNDEVDAVATAGHLRLDAEAAFDELVEHLELEAGLASLAQRLDDIGVMPERLLEVADDLAVERILPELRLTHGAEKVHAVASTR